MHQLACSGYAIRRKRHAASRWAISSGQERLTRPTGLVFPAAKDKGAALVVRTGGRENNNENGEGARERPDERSRIDHGQQARQEHVDRDGDQLRVRRFWSALCSTPDGIAPCKHKLGWSRVEPWWRDDLNARLDASGKGENSR